MTPWNVTLLAIRNTYCQGFATWNSLLRILTGDNTTECAQPLTLQQLFERLRRTRACWATRCIFKTMTKTRRSLNSCMGEHCPSEAFMICDTEDEEVLRSCTWIWDRGYARTGTGRQKRNAHKILMGDPPANGLSIDHIDGCRTNNRRSNLRWASKEEQTANRRRRGRNRACKSFWRDIYIDKDGLYHYNYDNCSGGPFSTALECRERMDALASI